MRVFVSLPLPDPVAEHLDLALEAVAGGEAEGSQRGGRPVIRWSSAEQRHVTLAFYGETPESAVDELRLELRRALAEVSPPTLRLRGAGVFSGRTLWAGVHDVLGRPHGSHRSGVTELMALCEGIGARYASAGERVVRDRRRAHVTLARVRDRRAGEGTLRGCAAALSVYEGPEWVADAAHLVRSELGAGRSGTALHETLEAIPLVG